MNIVGAYRIQADRQAVWRAINDPDILSQCIPGCESIGPDSPTEWRAVVVAKVGPVKARFNAEIRLEDLAAPMSCRIVGRGSGGAAGFANGTARVVLDEDGEATVLRYDADVEIGGKLAQIGARLIHAFAKNYADDFFATFSAVVGGGPANPLPVAIDRPAETPAAARFPAPLAGQGLHLPTPGPRPLGLDPHTFTTLLLAALLVFMTVMYALKP